MLPRTASSLARLCRASVTPLRPCVASRAPLLRPLHASARRLASEVPEDPLADPQIQRLYEQIRNHQPSVDAMMNIGKIMQEKGFDTSKPPSMVQMAKIAMDKELRDAGQKLVDELKNAGIELTPDVMKALMSKVRSSS